MKNRISFMIERHFSLYHKINTSSFTFSLKGEIFFYATNKKWREYFMFLVNVIH